jgi:alpha-beta hydrolase superfamily lysophospholipase
MPTFDGATGRVYYKAWRVPAPRTAALVFLHGFGEHSGLYHRLGNALNGAGIELWALDEIGHGLTESMTARSPSVSPRANGPSSTRSTTWSRTAAG